MILLSSILDKFLFIITFIMSSHGAPFQQLLMIEWHAIPLADESTSALTIQHPHEFVRRLLLDITQRVPDQEPMRVDTFVVWLQQ